MRSVEQFFVFLTYLKIPPMQTKLFITLLLVSAFSLHLRAQVSLKVGLGAQISEITLNSKDFSTSLGMGTHFNTSVQYGKRVYVEGGLQYFGTNQKIQARPTGAFPDPPENQARIAGLNIPVMVGYRAMDIDGPTTIHLFAGGNLRSILAERGESDYKQNQFRFVHIGALAGMGITHRVLYAELAYDFGVSNIFKDGFFPDGVDSRQNILRLTIGVHVFRN